MSRFNSKLFDERAAQLHDRATELCEELEELIILGNESGRAQSIALTKLEETHLWIGKFLKEEQTARETHATKV